MARAAEGAERTIPMGFSADEGLEIGKDLGSPSSPDYGPRGNEFNATIAWVQLDVCTTTTLLIALLARAALKGTRPKRCSRPRVSTTLRS